MCSSDLAIVVEGGAMRGVFASGVLDAFLEQSYKPFDFAIANEWALTQVYPLTVSPAVSTSVSTVCSNLNANQVSSGMSTICSVDQLTCRQIGVLDGVGFFKIESTAICGSGINQVQRIQEVWVRE